MAEVTRDRGIGQGLMTARGVAATPGAPTTASGDLT